MGDVQLYHRSSTAEYHILKGRLHFTSNVFVDGGMFLAASIGHRQERTVDVWGRGADLFFGSDAVSIKKLNAECTRKKDAILLGFQVDLQSDLTPLPGPKILGSINMINAPEFNPGCRTVGLRSVQELRGCINHWVNTGYIYGVGSQSRWIN